MKTDNTTIRELDPTELDAVAGAGFWGDAWDKAKSAGSKAKSAAAWSGRKVQSAHNRASEYFRNMGYNDTRC